MIDLENKCFCIFGLRGGGKSTLLKYLADQWGKHAFVFDTMKEIDSASDISSYKPQNSYSVPEMEMSIRAAVDSGDYSFIALDEANRFCPSKPQILPQEIARLNDLFRHKEYGHDGKLTMGYIARRPVQLHQDLTELAEYLFIFHLSGRSDRQYLNSISEGLGDVVTKLKPYHFAAVDSNRNYEICLPVNTSKSK